MIPPRRQTPHQIPTRTQNRVVGVVDLRVRPIRHQTNSMGMTAGTIGGMVGDEIKTRKTRREGPARMRMRNNPSRSRPERVVRRRAVVALQLSGSMPLDASLGREVGEGACTRVH